MRHVLQGAAASVILRMQDDDAAHETSPAASIPEPNFPPSPIHQAIDSVHTSSKHLDSTEENRMNDGILQACGDDETTHDHVLRSVTKKNKNKIGGTKKNR